MEVIQMTGEQIAHLRNLQTRFMALGYNKYSRGTQEHGGNLWEKPVFELLQEAMGEVVDLAMYIGTALDKAGGLPFEGEGEGLQANRASGVSGAKILESGSAHPVLNEIINEVWRSRNTYPKQDGQSFHHYWGVLDEEVAEWKTEVMKRPTERDKEAMRREAVQIAATMVRFIEEVL